MDNKYIEELRKKVKNALKDDKMRFRHTIGVADTCACLAMRYNEDMERAYIAGLLHDCAKCIPDDIKLRQCVDNGLSVSEIEMKSPYLLHSKLGALYAKNIYGINDDEICSSIEFHTTGKTDMSLLEKIVFIADYIEPYRNKATNLEQIRTLSFNDIDMAVFVILKDTIEYVKKCNKPLDTTTLDTYNYYKAVIESRKIQNTDNNDIMIC